VSGDNIDSGLPAFLGVRDRDLIDVGIGEIAMGQAPQRLHTPALGSCVGVALYDAVAMRGCLAHVMLPLRPPDADEGLPAGRFADTAIPHMLDLMAEAGSLKRRVEAKIAGGAAMFKGDSVVASIGDRNVAEVKRQLALASIALVAEDTGEAHARTIELVLGTGELIVRSYQFGIVRL
jgi:chemotaxis protein CheD